MKYFTSRLAQQLIKNKKDSPEQVLHRFLTIYQHWEKEFHCLQRERKIISAANAVEIRDQLLEQSIPFLRKLCSFYCTSDFWVAKVQYGWFSFYYDLQKIMLEFEQRVEIDKETIQIFTKGIKNVSKIRCFALVKKHSYWLIDSMQELSYVI